MIWVAAFAVVTALFVFVSGANDGATLVGLGVRYPRGSGLVTMGLLLVALVVVPVVFGFAVADTFTGRLADFSDPRGAAAFLGGISVALVVVGVLAWRGLPTSLTLAVIGGITGAGLGAGLPVSWGRVGTVLLVGALAPMVGGALAHLLGLGARRLPSGSGVTRWAYGVHLVAYAGQCAAYAANDGQKMFAVVSVGLDVLRARGIRASDLVSRVDLAVPVLIGVAALFGLGALLGLQRVGDRLGRGLVLARPMHIVVTELASGIAVSGSAALGAPVSMSQSVAAGVVGVAATEGSRRVRWQNVLSIVAAWLFTLPSALALGTLVGAGVPLVSR